MSDIRSVSASRHHSFAHGRLQEVGATLSIGFLSVFDSAAVIAFHSMIHASGTKKPPPSIEAAPGIPSGFAWLIFVSHLPSRTQDGLNRQSLLLDNKQQDQDDDQNQLIGKSHHSIKHPQIRSASRLGGACRST